MINVFWETKSWEVFWSPDPVQTALETLELDGLPLEVAWATSACWSSSSRHSTIRVSRTDSCCVLVPRDKQKLKFRSQHQLCDYVCLQLLGVSVATMFAPTIGLSLRLMHAIWRNELNNIIPHLYRSLANNTPCFAEQPRWHARLDCSSAVRRWKMYIKTQMKDYIALGTCSFLVGSPGLHFHFPQASVRFVPNGDLLVLRKLFPKLQLRRPDIHHQGPGLQLRRQDIHHQGPGVVMGIKHMHMLHGKPEALLLARWQGKTCCEISIMIRFNNFSGIFQLQIQSWL